MHEELVLPRVLKRTRVSAEPYDGGVDFHLPQPRLARSRVRVADDQPKEEPPAFTLHHVIRGSRAQVQAQRYAVPEFTGTVFELDDSAPFDADPLPEAPPPPPSFSHEDVLVMREQWEAQLQARFEAERNAAVAQAREEAAVQARAEAEATFAAERQALEETLTAQCEVFAARWEAYLEDLQPHLVDIALRVAEEVVAGPLPAELREVSTEALTLAVERLGATTPVDVHLHPVDLLSAQESGLVEQLTAAVPGTRWTPSPTMREGDWSVETDESVVRRVREEIILNLRRDLGLLTEE